MKYSFAITTFPTSITYSCTMTTDEGVYAGTFSISNYQNIPSMGIDIEDDHQHKGYARIMIRTVINRLPKWSPNKLLYIDADASAGFWKHIGMYENTNGNGYELAISTKSLSQFAKQGE